MIFATALVAVPAALAKGPDTVRICGADRCVTVQGPGKVNRLALLTTGFESRAAPHSSPFYTVELTSSRQAAVRWSLLYVPSAPAIKVIRADFSGTNRQETTNTWVKPGADAMAAYSAATTDMEPYPADVRWRPTPTSDGGDSFPWPVAAGVAIAAAALGGLALMLRRRPLRRQPAVAPD